MNVPGWEMRSGAPARRLAPPLGAARDAIAYARWAFEIELNAVTDNPHSWFEHFDLVFVDPPHTGWSLAASDDDLEAVEGVGGGRAKDIREGLRRLQEINLVDRYLQT